MLVVSIIHVGITFSCSNIHAMANFVIKNPQSLSAAAAEVTGNTALVHVQQYVQVWGNGCTHYLLTQHWENLKVSAEEN